MIKIHGMQKIVDRLKQDFASLKEGQQVLIEWPGHFEIMLHKETESRFELTVRGMRGSDVSELVKSLDIQGWNASMRPSLLWGVQ